MPREIIMPQMGESVAEGTILKWLVKEGERVEKEQPLVEISTDKIDTEIPSPVTGILKTILHNVDETVPVGIVIAVIEELKGDAAIAATVPTPVIKPEKAATEKLTEEVPPEGIVTKRIYTPLVRRLAKEYGIDLETIYGTGAGGRITKEDILDYVERTQKIPLNASSMSSMSGPAEVINQEDREELVPVSSKRRIIAERMVKSTSEIPHVTTTFEVDMTAIANYRDANKDAFLKENGVHLTYLSFIIASAAAALKKYPMLNSSWTDKGILIKRYFNIGIAVSIEDGLIVPVIKGADTKGLIDIARLVQELAKMAREKRLSVEDVQDGTFTVTNYGIGGSLFGTPIILPGQTAILGVGAIIKRPVIINDAIAVRQMVYLSLSFDHRIIDGAQADQFLSKIKVELEGWRGKSEKVQSSAAAFGGVW
ncbi:MAG: dihydrolipoamide acetyltransferase family protein [Nitrospira sp.]|nr:dihydrolipoamide acetyltransferase family protein [Nitrospira sp.]